MRLAEMHRRMIRQRPDVRMLIEEICVYTGQGLDVANVWINQGAAAARAARSGTVQPTRATIPVAPAPAER